MKTASAALLATLALAACSPMASEEAAYVDQKVAVEPYAPAAMEAAVGQAAPADAGGATAPSEIPDAVLPQLAYDYSYGFSGDATHIEGLVKADQAACDKAGLSACQMISLSSNSSPDNRSVSKTLELRVSPDWLKRWKGGLQASLKAHRARIVSENVTSEDLSLRIVDTEAHIKNREALRDRLQQIIRTHSGKVSELVEAEAQLSNVQAEIDSARSALAVMKKRVATVHVTLSYNSDSVAASGSVFEPVVSAFKGFLRAFMEMLGLIINLIAYLLPLAIIGVPAWIYGRKWWLKRKAKAAETAAKKD